MSEPIRPMVVDLSHWDPAYDYVAVKSSGIYGVIYKATEGDGYQDPTYEDQRDAAKKAGLLWGAYHFATAEDVGAQVQNFLSYASPESGELVCLDWEDYGSNTMSVAQCKEWIEGVESALGRPGSVVIYSGNTAKEMLGGNDDFFGSRRLWLAQYGTQPVPQESWETYWLWQFTDGIYGPDPHEIPGVGPCDINSYQGPIQMLRKEWADGRGDPNVNPIPKPQVAVVKIDLTVPDGIRIEASVNGIPIRTRGERR